MKQRNSIVRFAFVSFVVCCVMAMPLTASAETIMQSTLSSSFTQSWSKTIEKFPSDGSHLILTYGFDTFLIHEDFAYAYSNGSHHASKVRHDGHSHYGPWKWANDWSDLEVMHDGSTVYYYHVYD